MERLKVELLVPANSERSGRDLLACSGVVARTRYRAPLEEGVEGLGHELLLGEDNGEAAEQGEVSLIRS